MQKRIEMVRNNSVIEETERHCSTWSSAMPDGGPSSRTYNSESPSGGSRIYQRYIICSNSSRQCSAQDCSSFIIQHMGGILFIAKGQNFRMFCSNRDRFMRLHYHVCKEKKHLTFHPGNRFLYKPIFNYDKI